MSDGRATPDRVQYDGATYTAVRYYECTCGFAVKAGEMDKRGAFPGGKVMVDHLVEAHGWRRIGATRS